MADVIEEKPWGEYPGPVHNGDEVQDENGAFVCYAWPGMFNAGDGQRTVWPEGYELTEDEQEDDFLAWAFGNLCQEDESWVGEFDELGVAQEAAARGYGI